MLIRARQGNRVGNASLELVLVTAVAVPLGVLLLLLGARMAVYVINACTGLMVSPWL